VLAVTLVLLALVVGVVGTTLGLLQARTAAQAEREAREAEAEQRQQAEASEKKASEEAAVAKAVREFLQQDLLGLAGAAAQLGAEIEPDPNVKLTTLLDRAAAKVDERFADEPRVRAAVQDTLARAYESIGRYAEAVRLWERVRQYCETVQANHPATLAVMSHLAQAYGSAGQHKKALELARQTLELKRKILGPARPRQSRHAREHVARGGESCPTASRC
jgi:non-specific serine/threonine protein kinase/serine/threonine-protein kinase